MNTTTMNKKGQVSTFVIVGIVIVVLLALVLVGRQTIFLPTTPESLANIQSDIDTHITECISDAEVSEEPIIRLGQQGGYLTPGIDTYRLFNDSTVAYLCYNIDETEQCRNRLLLKNTMEVQLNQALKPRILNCIGDMQSYARLKPITIETPQDLVVNTEIQQESIIVNINYPVIIKSTRNENRVEQDVFTEALNYPLGDLYLVIQSILEQEIQLGDFDPLLYMLAKRGEYIIIKQRPYPDKLYQIKRNNHPYVFEFFVQGQPG